MGGFSSTVERLRTVRQAQRSFLRLWALEQSVILPALDQLAADAQRHSAMLTTDRSAAPLDGPPSVVDK